jgi:transposase
MFYVGLDVHSKFIVICILNSKGKVHARYRVRLVAELLVILKSLPRFRVCYEASCGYGWLHDQLTPLAERVVVAHPGLLKWIFRSKNKNDRLDAERLAKLLYVDEVPAVHVPRSDIRAWRELINFRRRTVAKRTRAKNALRALLRSVGLKPPARPGLWSKKGLQWMRELEFAEPLHAIKRDMLLEEIQSLSQQIARLEQALAKYSLNNPAVKLLRSIPGIGLRTSEAMVAFIDDPHRFAKAVSRSGSRVGIWLHPGIRHGELERRPNEWEQPHSIFWRSVPQMTPNGCLGIPAFIPFSTLTEAFSWMTNQ